MSKKQFKLISDDVKRHVCRQIVAADWGMIVTIAEPTRSLESNARFHAMLSDISRQAEYLGKRRGVDFWKAVFVSGWELATGQKPEIVPGLEGEFINIRQSTTTLGARKMSELMDYVSAWGAMQGIRFTAKDLD